jgi:hypothetical protein
VRAAISGVDTRLKPHKRYFNARPFDGRMAFVPEGQADRSQARSAWAAMQRGPRPGGTVEVMVRDICRRNGVHVALETPGIPVER